MSLNGKPLEGTDLERALQNLHDRRAFAEPLIGYSDAVAAESRELKRFLREHLYRHHQVYRVMEKAKRVLRELFEAFMRDPRLLPPQSHAETVSAQDEAGRARIVADYIAGMTDRFASREHTRLCASSATPWPTRSPRAAELR